MQEEDPRHYAVNLKPRTRRKINTGVAKAIRLAKKVGALRTNLSKLEHLRYELALVKGSNRKTFSVSAPTASTANAGIDDENDE